MPLDVGMAMAKLEAHFLLFGVTLQAIACLMSDANRLHLVQIGIGLIGVLLMIIGIGHLSG